MSDPVQQHTRFMQRALELALAGLYTTAPNPRVGCLLVRDGEVIGSGFHRLAGTAHAEINAIADARSRGHQTAGASAYVTLEPCSHTGKTPPCCEALIAAQIAAVWVGMVDPNPLVAGRGIAALRAAAIEVEVGLLESECRALNPGFIMRMESGRPRVRAKLAMSLDGRTAMASGESQWITGAPARSAVQQLRAQSCAIVSGINTVLQDNASLTVRVDELGLAAELAAQAAQTQPLRVVLDSTLRLPPTAKLLSQPGATVIVAAGKNTAAEQALVAAGAEVIYLPASDGKIDLPALLAVLAQRQCNEVLLECGATLAGAMASQGLIDHYTVFMAPTLMGNTARGLLALPLTTMAEQQRLHIDSITPVGDDWRIEARPASPG